ncbi:MAG: phytoene desaturase family protein [Myxococcaceae bacterium]
MVDRAVPSSCDVVVIGAGIGGLTAAAVLAKAGLSVCVVEMAGRPGGYLAGFERQGFCFDTAIHWLNQCGPGGLVRRIFDFIGPGSPETSPHRRIRRYRGVGFDYLLTNNPDELRDQLIRDFPAERRGITRFFADARQLGAAFSGFPDRMRARETMGWFERMRFHLAMGLFSWPFLKHLGRSAEKGLKRYFKDEALRRIFCSEEEMLSCLVPIGWAYFGDFQLAPRGGSRMFPRWLCQVLEAFGGSVVYGARVNEIKLEGKRAVGVRFTKGGHPTEIACKHVIAACDVESVYERMLPQGTIDPRFLEKLRGGDLYDSSVTMAIGLNVPAQELGFDEELIFLTPDGVSRQDLSGGDPEKAGLNVFSPSARDPSLAPPGKGTLTVYATANMRYADRWKTGPGLHRGPEYQALKKEYAEVLIRRLEKTLAPTLRKHIEVLDIATPVTHQRYTGNRDGSLMGARATGKNIRAGLAHYRTPVRNLLLGGQWAEYGGGVPVAVRAGTNSAAIVLQQERPEAFAVLRDVLDGKRAPREIESGALKAYLPAGVAPDPQQR